MFSFLHFLTESSNPLMLDVRSGFVLRAPCIKQQQNLKVYTCMVNQLIEMTGV
jgi:hypothetical protein